MIRFLIIFFLFFSVSASGLTLKEVEARMVYGGYLDTLYVAYWAAKQGEVIVPLLGKVLFKYPKYQNEPSASAGAYPFNIIWALAQIDSDHSLKILIKFFGWTTDKLNHELAQLAIEGFQLRRSKQGKTYGILVRREAKLLEKPSEKAGVRRVVRSGQKVRIVKSYIENLNEEGARSGPAVFDYVELIPQEDRGYIQRFGGDFTSFI